MVGLKFGTSQAAAATWATNAYLPGVVSRRFAQSRIVSFSTGNVYPLVPVESGGCRETDPLQPVGEYGMSAMARERVFEHFSRTLQIPMAILRLNYAVEMRYGVLVDLAQQIWAERPVSLAMGYFNCIWQGDANELTLRSLPLTEVPPRVFNLTGPTVLSTRDVCEQIAARMGKPALFCDEPAPTALLNDARASLDVLGAPATPLADLVTWTADWVAREAPTLNRPTHFEVRDGQF
jgi:nucleoside-diphosphate-sugar epimerase